MKRVLAFILVILIGISLCACKSKEEKVDSQIQGTWVSEAMHGSNYPAVITFDKGMASKSNTERDASVIATVDGKYEFDKGQRIIVTYEDGTKLEFIAYVAEYTETNKYGIVLNCMDTGAYYIKKQ